MHTTLLSNDNLFVHVFGRELSSHNQWEASQRLSLHANQLNFVGNASNLGIHPQGNDIDARKKDQPGPKHQERATKKDSWLPQK